jgi:hypothetical protein
VARRGADKLRTLLAFAAAVEVGTGFLLLIAPERFVALLLGADVSGDAALLGRFLGIALLAFGVACWPSRKHVKDGSPAFRGMLIYNAGVALYLGIVGTFGHVGGVLLWPAVVLHAVVTFLLLRASRDVASANGAPTP